MNMILLLPDDFLPGGRRVRLSGRRLQHVREVHRATVGDTLRVGLLEGRTGSGEVLQLTDEILDLEVRLDQEPPPALPVTLVLALPRPATIGRILQGLAATGVKRIFLINGRRVEKSYWTSRALAKDAMRDHLLQGLEQARDTVLPEVSLRPRFRPFVEDESADLIRGTRALVAHPEAACECPRGIAGGISLAVGPEGGFVPFEVDLLRANGFTAVSLGSRPMRVEHVIPFLIGRLV